MVLISYIEPYIIIHCDQLATGEVDIKSKSDVPVWYGKFSNKEYLNIKVKPSWPKSLVVKINANGHKTRKEINL